MGGGPEEKWGTISTLASPPAILPQALPRLGTQWDSLGPCLLGPHPHHCFRCLCCQYRDTTPALELPKGTGSDKRNWQRELMLKATHTGSKTVHYWVRSGQSEHLPCDGFPLAVRDIYIPQLLRGGTLLLSQPKVSETGRSLKRGSESEGLSKTPGRRSLMFSIGKKKALPKLTVRTASHSWK